MTTSNQASRQRFRRTMVTVVVVIIALLLICAALLIYRLVDRAAPASEQTTPGSNSRQVTLVVAYSPEKAEVFEELVAAFNETKPHLSSNKAVVIEPLSLAPDKMVAEAAAGTFQALSPDSSIWLGEIDRNWSAEHGADASLVGETVRYMVSPVVIAMWRDAATELGYPEQDLGWSDILQAAKDNGLRWSHPSTNNASGLLATLAEFYVGAGETRGLTEEMVNAPDTIAYVTELERTVKHYGEGELAIMERIAQQGRDFLDAFVVQEQLVVRHNMQHGLELVAIYPSEGTLWEDHPLALLETPERTDEERQAFQLFREYLLSEEVQSLVLARGYRPADLSISLASPQSPIYDANGVDPARPYTTMQIPSSAVIKVVKDAWLFTKRHANVYLVVDVSGSMAGAKLEDAQQALAAFIDQMSGDWERVGLITFASDVSEQMPLTQLSQGRDTLLTSIEQLRAGGNTALVDGVGLAYIKLADLADTERINAIVVMTDGRENASLTAASTLAAHIEQGTQSDMPILVFCIAYGSDADYQVLERLAAAGNGFAAEGDMETIRTLYETLSTYF